MDLYSALDNKYLVLKALRHLRHESHGLTCKQHHARLNLAFVRVHQMAPPLTPSEFCENFDASKTRMIVLPYGEKKL